MKTHITAALVTLFALSLGGCGGGYTSPPPQPSPLPVIVSFAVGRWGADLPADREE